MTQSLNFGVSSLYLSFKGFRKPLKIRYRKETHKFKEKGPQKRPKKILIIKQKFLFHRKSLKERYREETTKFKEKRPKKRPKKNLLVSNKSCSSTGNL